MARERYLVGVSDDELKPDPKPESPKTAKGKLENYWYHYKWPTIIFSIVAVVLIIMITQLTSRNLPDYTLVIATNSIIPEPSSNRLAQEFEKYGQDVDEDGEVEVRVEVLDLGSQTQYGMMSQTKLLAHFTAADVMLFAFDEQTYQQNIVERETEGYHFFAPLNVQANGIQDNGRYWNWNEDELRNDPDLKVLPKDLFFGVRDMSGTARKADAEMYENSLKLMQAFLENR